MVASGTTKFLRRLLGLLTPREQKQAYRIQLLVGVVALSELLAIAVIFPFFVVLSAPEKIQEIAIFRNIRDQLGIANEHHFLILLAGATFLIIVSAALMRSLGDFVIARFVHMCRHSIATRLMAKYLDQPYKFFQHTHSAELSKNILSEVEHFAMFVILPLMRLTAALVTFFTISALLIFLNPMVATTVGMTMIGAYALIFLSIKRVLAKNSARRVAYDQLRHHIVRETFSGIKDIRISAKEKVALDRFTEPSKAVARIHANNQVLAQLPKYLVEAIGLGSILLLCVWLLTRPGESGSSMQILPELGLYCFAIYRLLPSVQAIYRSVVELRSGAGAVSTLHTEFETLSKTPNPTKTVTNSPYRGNICLEKVSFAHTGDRPSLRNISVDFPWRKSVGIVGSSGAGKSTLIDVVLGLVTPDSGAVRIGGALLSKENATQWQSCIGYVPQQIYLSDLTIAQNIAFGCSDDEIDSNQVRSVLKLAQLEEFVNQLPNGVYTQIGEAGVRLSGGQRQRIGIARALYKKPSVLIFDEATSALDPVTERKVLASISATAEQTSTIIVAHRLTTVRSCDHIIMMQDGAVAAVGTYDELRHANNDFASFVEACA